MQHVLEQESNKTQRKYAFTIKLLFYFIFLYIFCLLTNEFFFFPNNKTLIVWETSIYIWEFLKDRPLNVDLKNLWALETI